MADHPRVSTPVGSRSTIRRNLRSTSQSPSRHQHRLGDDFLSQLSPDVAVDALRSPTGALKTCMDQASASEQAFAMRTATASKKIRDWLDEVSNWPWPQHSVSAGFEMPPAKRRRLFEPDEMGDDHKGERPESDLTHDTDYLGSLPAADVDRYEMRAEQIQKDLDNLDVEEIKSQVLQNHILPLSRPGSPFSEGGRSTTSVSMFAKMEDLTAVVTAITVQALPDLSRLSRLLNVWTMRLLVMRKVPVLLTMFADAKVALRSGWNAIESADSSPSRSNGSEDNTNQKLPGLSRKDFDVMKHVIQQKVTKPGRALDYMLDTLEGSTDTLPDEWLDRMEEIEGDYAIWETTAERKVRAGERSDLFGASPQQIYRPEPETPRPKIQVHSPSPTKDLPDSSDFNQFASPPLPFDSSPEGIPGNVLNMHFKGAVNTPSPRGAVKILVDNPSRDISGSTRQVTDLSRQVGHQRDVDSGTRNNDPSLGYDGTRENRPTATKKTAFNPLSVSRDLPHLPRPKQPRGQAYGGFVNTQMTDRGQTSPVLGEVDRNVVRSPPQEPRKPDTGAQRESTVLDEPESPVLEPSVLEPVDEEGEEPELPPARFIQHRDSRESIASTVIHGPPGGFLDNSDNAPFREGSMEPDLPRLPDPNEPFSSDAISPPSSPPLRYKTRSTSVTFKDVPDIAPLPEAATTPPRSPFEPSEVFDADTSFDYESQLGSPSRMSSTSSFSEDEHLHQQISDILESIPAKIRFKRTPGINLNPPDLQLPLRPKPKGDGMRRSNSSLSSRADTPSYSRSGTPSFMLAPARDLRPRSKSSQGIRVYHLTRSTGEPPLKLLIRCVGENGERVMVRIGGGWADLGEYLREYATHHSSRSKGEGKVDIRDLPVVPSGLASSPSSRPASAMDSPITPLTVRKTRRSLGEEGNPRFPKTPLLNTAVKQESDTPSSETSARSSHMDWNEGDSALGLAGPKGKKMDMSEESRAWVESVKEKVRIASGERPAPPEQRLDTKFGEIGKVGGTKRLFRKN
ncbi:hypothetical protein GGR54DRAFT_77486 [Hypoxylon sp. NC1633]|nr:hypothetical protein GGR54DRAFT_77486 [Hypoxylon sp. NC1633]